MAQEGTVRLTNKAGPRSYTAAMPHADSPRPSLPAPSLSSGGDQPCGLALFPVSPEPSHGRRNAGGARDLRDLRDRASVGEEVRQDIRRSDPPARACLRRQMAYG